MYKRTIFLAVAAVGLLANAAMSDPTCAHHTCGHCGQSLDSSVQPAGRQSDRVRTRAVTSSGRTEATAATRAPINAGPAVTPAPASARAATAPAPASGEATKTKEAPPAAGMPANMPGM